MEECEVKSNLKKKLKRNKEELAVTFGMRQLSYEATGKEAPIADEVFFCRKKDPQTSLNNHVLKNEDLFNRKKAMIDKVQTHPVETVHLKFPVSTKEY
uniref:Dynein light chain n=1 Tax=Rhabditophanes sp. KR3021 TaxID=114890 RepID=A0AC35UA41_9BILA